MTRVICTTNYDSPDVRLYMYAPDCFSANPFCAIQFHVEGAARAFGDLCNCHEGDYIWDCDTEKVLYSWGKDKNDA